jgi:hypothetical protein
MPLTLDDWRRALAAPPGQMPADVVDAVMIAFECYLRNAPDGMTLNRAFEAAGPSGGDPWYKKLARERLHRALRELAGVVCPTGSRRRMASAALLEVRRYRPNNVGTPARLRGLLEIIHREGALCEIPQSPDTIENILAGQVTEIVDEPCHFKTPSRNGT